MAYESLPEVAPKDRPRPLYFRHSLTAEEQLVVQEKGWTATDVRLIRDPQEAIKATLEGARIGVIALSDEDLSNLMAEAKVYGLLANKKSEEDSPNKEKAMEKDDLDSILAFASSSSANNKTKEKAKETNSSKATTRRIKKKEGSTT